MALHQGLMRCGLTVDVRFWPIPIPTPRALDEAMTPGWRRTSLWIYRLHLGWLIRKRVLATDCDCCTPEEFNP